MAYSTSTSSLERCRAGDRPRSLALNDIGRIRLALASPLPIDSYREHRATGAFIIVDDADGWTLGAGLAGSTPLTAKTATLCVLSLSKGVLGKLSTHHSQH